MVLVSTSESLKSKEVSFLAIVETILAVGIYWGLAAYYDMYWHLISSILVAPLLLLSSDKSVKIGIRLIYTLSKGKNISYIFSMVLMLIAGIFTFIYEFGYLLPNLENLSILEVYSTFSFLGFLIALDIIFGKKSYADKNQKKENFLVEIILSILMFLLLPSISIGIGLSILLVFTLYKIVAIVLSLKYGYKNIKTNWFYYTFLLDLRKTPEIMTDIEKYKSIDSLYKFSNFSTMMKEKNSFFIKATFLIMYITLYPFAIFYRLSIKSTFWFYIPLLFVIKNPNLTTSQNIGKFLSELYSTIWAWYNEPQKLDQ